MRTLCVPENLFANSRAPYLFNDLVNELLPRANNCTAAPKASLFPLDVEERDGGYAIVANLPGVGKEAVDITLVNERLTIKVAEPKADEANAKRYLHRERRAGAMERTIALKDAAPESIEAVLQDGVLTVFVKKDERRLPKKIQIR